MGWHSSALFSSKHKDWIQPAIWKVAVTRSSFWNEYKCGSEAPPLVDLLVPTAGTKKMVCRNYIGEDQACSWILWLWGRWERGLRRLAPSPSDFNAAQLTWYYTFWSLQHLQSFCWVFSLFSLFVSLVGSSRVQHSASARLIGRDLSTTDYLSLHPAHLPLITQIRR